MNQNHLLHNMPVTLMILISYSKYYINDFLMSYTAIVMYLYIVAVFLIFMLETSFFIKRKKKQLNKPSLLY